MVKVCLSALLLIFATQVMAAQDPTAPLGWQQPKQGSHSAAVKRKPLPKLQSIICNDGSVCSAIVNGRVVSVGEHISGYKISQIKPEVVTLVRGGKQWKLNLFSLEVKQ